jgi:hypothetical protein
MGEGSEGWSDFYGSVRPRYVESEDVRNALWATDEFESDEVRCSARGACRGAWGAGAPGVRQPRSSGSHWAPPGAACAWPAVTRASRCAALLATSHRNTDTPQHTHTHTHTATHTHTLQHTHTHCNTHTATHTLQHTHAHCNTHTATHTHCNAHTATHTRSTGQHGERVGARVCGCGAGPQAGGPHELAVQPAAQVCARARACVCVCGGGGARHARVRAVGCRQ